VTTGGRRPLVAGLALVLLALLAGCGGDSGGTTAPAGSPSSAAGASTTAPTPERSAPTGTSAAASAKASPKRKPAVGSYKYSPGYKEVADPVRIRIAAARVDAPIKTLGLDKDGAIQVPGTNEDTGWFTGSVRPGAPGPAVILGHVDGEKKPAVFFHLHKLRPGDKIVIDRADGSTVTFLVNKLQQTPKTRFPTDDVYAPTLQGSLRLVTCGGTFDSSIGHYRDNVIVFADLVPPTQR
jgi:hypothetical protein